MSDEIARLLDRGELLPAALSMCRAGRHDEALEVLLRLSMHDRAAECARHADRFVDAHAAHLMARDWQGAAADRQMALGRASPAALDETRRALAAACVAAGREGEAAALFEIAGELAAAAAAYERAGDRLAAARLFTFLGRHREAAQFLAGHLRGLQGGGTLEEITDARIALCRTLLRLGRPDEAMPHLQAVLASEVGDRLHRQALVLSLQSLVSLGYPAAAEATWLRLTPLVDDPPADYRTFLARLALDREETGEDAEERFVAGRYRLQRLLGAGGAGQVYLAVDIASGNEVALKLLSPGLVRGGGGGVDRFFREARVARTLDHPALVRVVEADPERGYIAMEYLSGGTLSERLRGGRRLSPVAVQRVGDVIAAGLSAAHRRGVLHRDVKPDNVLFDEAGHPHLGDFGVAHLISFKQTGTGYLLGTLAYMAPEQLDQAQLGASTDLWGLTVTLYRALTGRLPFPGPGIVDQHRAGAASPSEIVAGLDPRVDAFFARGLALRPGDRFENAEAYREALLEFGWSSLRVEDRAPSTDGQEVEVRRALLPSDRYENLVSLGARVSLTRDTVLMRHLVLERVPEDEPDAYLERVAALARAGNPFLQTVVDVDPDRGLAIWAFVDGVRLPDAFAQPVDEALALQVAIDVARALVDHPGPIRPGRVLIVDGRAVVTVAGAEALRSAPPPGDPRPDVGRVLGWGLEGRDPGPTAQPLSRFSEAPVPSGAGHLAQWLEAARRSR